MNVLTDHAIEGFNFALWEGGPPRLVKQTLETFSKPGAPHVGQQVSGVRGREFEVVLTAYFTTYVGALNRWSQYLAVPGQRAVFVKHANVHFVTFNHTYLVNDIVLEQLKMIPHAIGTSAAGVSYSYAPAAKLVTRWQMIPLRSF